MLSTAGVALLLGTTLAACSGPRAEATGTPKTRELGLPTGDGDSVQVAELALAKCAKVADRTGCYEEILFALVGADKVRLAMGALHVIGDRDPSVVANSHQYTHGIGIAAYAPDKEVGKVFASCTELYQSGCYHGVIQAYFSSRPSVDSAVVRALCADYTHDASNRWLRYQCVHGMGHGLTMFYSRNLMKALEGCDFLRTEWDRTSCYSGAFMENIVGTTAQQHHAAATHTAAAKAVATQAGATDTAGGHDHAAMEHDHAAMMAADEPPFKATDPNDLHYPCSIVGERYQDACYVMQTAIILPATGRDYAATAKVCDGAPEPQRAMCYQSMGTNASGETTGDDARAIELCSKGTEAYQPWCFYGVVLDRIYAFARVDDGFPFCAQVPGERNKLKCYEGVGEQAATLNNDLKVREALCDKAPEGDHRLACRYGARLGSARPAALPTRGEKYRS
jgi:hypothetical protein